MKAIGNQWVEVIEGKEHLLVIVENTSNLVCGGCDFGYYQAGDHLCSFGLDCPASCGVVKDLGIINDDGCLPTQWDKYKYPVVEKHQSLWYVQAVLRYGVITAQGLTRQEAIDNWNRR